MKAELRSRACFIAGATDFMLEWRHGALQPSHVIDLSFIAGLRLRSETLGELRLGATHTLSDLSTADGLGWPAQVFASTASRMATPQLRTVATVGGNVCHASPCADMAILLAALDAVYTVASTAGTREVAVADFFTGVNATALGDDEMLTSIGVPLPAAPTAASYQRVSRTSVDLAQASAAVRLSSCDSHTISDSRVVIGACSPAPARSRDAEQALLGLDLRAPDTKAIAEAGRLADRATSPISDVRCTAEYRHRVSPVLVRRAVLEAIALLVRDVRPGHGRAEARSQL